MSSVPNENEIYTVFVCYPSTVIKKMNVRGKMKVNLLRKIIPDIPGKFLFAGRYVDEQRSFVENGIYYDDVIVVIANDNSSLETKWFNITAENDAFKEKMVAIMNKNVSGEILRLRDLHQTRLEGKKKTYNAMKQKLFNKTEMNFFHPAFETILGEQLSEPNSEALPVVWQTSQNLQNEVIVHQDSTEVVDDAVKVFRPQVQ